MAAGLLTGCSGQLAQPSAAIVAPSSSTGLHGTDVGDVITRPALRLRDTAGASFDLRRRPPSEVTLLFFGYTRCPDLCPTVMADLATARRKIPTSLKDRVQIVFVTEDPTHDTPSVLRRWLDRFDPSIRGLLGGGSSTQATLDALKTTRTERTAKAASGKDQIEHSGSVYAFAGRRVVVYTGGTTPRQYADDLVLLLT